jgi:hypothetical protein
MQERAPHDPRLFSSQLVDAVPLHIRNTALKTAGSLTLLCGGWTFSVAGARRGKRRGPRGKSPSLPVPSRSQGTYVRPVY